MRAFIASFGYAARGVGRAVQAERNFRFELCAAVYVLLACPFFGFAPAEWALVFLCIGGVLALELVNSAIERAVEDPDPAHWRPAGAAKDMAAGAVLAAGGKVLLTADHGNADQMREPDGAPFTAHTTNPVPFLVAGAGDVALRQGGVLADIAPTMLKLLGLPQPPEMTGSSIIE